VSDIISVLTSTYLPIVAGFEAKIVLEEASFLENTDCQIKARNDLQAAYYWLNLYADVLKTYDTYKREVERLLLWCKYESGRCLRELKVEDFENYFNFLKNPPFEWCATRSQLRKGRESTEWRPFVGPLNESAFLMAVRVVNSCLNYLVEAQYLRSNPIKLMRKHKTFSMDTEETKYRVWERMLEMDEWEAVQEALREMPEQTEGEMANKMRTQFLFALGYMAGLRIHEMAEHCWNAFRKLDGKWFLFIRGKGGKLRHVPVNDQLLSFMKVYRLSLNKLALPSAEEQEPLFVSKRTEKALSIRQLHDLVKAVGEMAAQKFKNNPLKAQKLRKFSAHWLRHMSASHQDKAGISSVMIRETMGHSSEAVTKIYKHSENELRHEAMQKMQLKVTPRLIEKPTEKAVVLLTLSFTGRPLDKVSSLGRLLDLIEAEIFKDLDWSRKGFDKEEVLKHFAQKKQYGQGVLVGYELKEITKETLAGAEKAILRECEIRLLECNVNEKLFLG
jgi:site-specific recombinase XerD